MKPSAAAGYARRSALGSYAIFWFLGNLVIESSVIRLETVFEHRTYLPSVMPAVVLSAMVFRLFRRKWAAVAVLSVLSLGWAGWTWQRRRQGSRADTWVSRKVDILVMELTRYRRP